MNALRALNGSTPSKVLTGAGGVLIHQFTDESGEHPWRPCGTHCVGFIDCSCTGTRDQVVAALLFRGMPRGSRDRIPLQSRRLGGVILRANTHKMHCSFATDGGTQGVHCFDTQYFVPGDCVPGCMARTALNAGSWCSDPAAQNQGRWCNGRPWKPQDLGSMLEVYSSGGAEPGKVDYVNQIILDPTIWEQHLPGSIEGFWFPDTVECSAVHCEKNVKLARKDFETHFGMKPAQIPVVTLRPDDSTNPFRPVSTVENQVESYDAVDESADAPSTLFPEVKSVPSVKPVATPENIGTGDSSYDDIIERDDGKA